MVKLGLKNKEGWVWNHLQVKGTVSEAGKRTISGFVGGGV